MRSEELSVELRDRIVSRHRSGEGYQNISASLKVPKNTVASIILKWMKFGTPKTVEKGLGQGVTKNSMVTLTELQSSSVEMGEPSLGSHMRKNTYLIHFRKGCNM
jgi:hypothetical protein